MSIKPSKDSYYSLQSI